MARGPKRIFLTGTALSGVTSTAMALGAHFEPPLDPKRTPYDRGGGWRVRQHLGWVVPYDLVRDANDADVAAEADFLRAAEAIFFVADSQTVRREANLAAVERLREALVRLKRDPAQLELAFALNKRDLPDVASVADLTAELRLGNAFHLPTVAIGNVGLAEVLAALAL